VVKGYSYNGTVAPAFTNFYGLYDRYYSHSPEDWALPDRWITPPDSFDLDPPLNIVSTNDISGGSSGSPLLNKDLEIVGVIFDSNMQALPNEYLYRDREGRAISVDVRVIAATNKDLLEEIEEGNFREDLYHRIGVILIKVPPLRRRREDIPMLTEHGAERLARRNGLPPKAFTDDALDRLKSYDWRGNVRELYNVVERLLILADGDAIQVDDVEQFVQPGPASDRPEQALIDAHDDFTQARDQFEKQFIEQKLHEHDWNVSQTAETIGIQRSHLYNKLNKYGIEREE